VFGHDLHRASDIAAFHSLGPDQLRRAIGDREVDLGLAVTEHMNMGGLVVIEEDNDAQSVNSKDGDHQ